MEEGVCEEVEVAVRVVVPGDTEMVRVGVEDWVCVLDTVEVKV